MLWLYAEDVKYYGKDYVLSLERKYKKVLIAPSKEEIRQEIRKGEEFVVLAPYMPPEEFKSFFAYMELTNTHGLWTEQDIKLLKELSLSEGELLEKKTGFKIYKPDLQGKKLIGVSGVQRYIRSVKDIKDPKLKPKGVLLVGLPGTGKSFSAKVAAHELGGFLVEFNVARLVEMENPVFFLHSLFSYLEKASKQGERFILWIDEIEKAFGKNEGREKQIFGQLLTILNDINDTGYKLNGLFWVTANNIIQIMDNNPEFFRKGRFDELFFVDTPLKKDAIEIGNFYCGYYGVDYSGRKSFGEEMVDIVDNYVYAEKSMKEGSHEADRFLYVPAEIEQIAKAMAIRQHLVRKFTSGDESLYPLLFPRSLERGDVDIKRFLYVKIGSAGYEDIRRYYALHNNKVNDLDLFVVLKSMEPLSVSMAQAVAKMRSNERFFTRAD